MKIGFIGLGAMGRGMVENLLRQGHQLHVWNRSSAPLAAMVEQGAVAADSPLALADCDVLLSILANDQAVREVVVDSGLLAALRPGALHVNHATVSVALAGQLAQQHAARGVGYLTATVFGRPEVAAAGKLNMLLSGPADQQARIRPLLEQMAGRVWPLGEDPAHAAVAKIAGNMMLAAAVEAMGEASALTRAHGLPAADFLEIMLSTVFACPIYQNYGKLIAEQRYEPAGFALALGHKDVGLALAAGQAQQVPLPLASLLHDGLTEALAAGEGHIDLAGLARVSACRAHLDERGK